MRTLQTLLAFAFLAVTVSCTGGRHKANAIDFDTISVQETYHFLSDTTNPGCLLTQTFVFPKTWPDATLLTAAQRFFVEAFYGEGYEGDAPAEASKRYVNAYLNKYIGLEPDFVEDAEIAEPISLEAWFSYYEHRRDTILYNQDDILSFAVYVSAFTGGAHGYETTSFYSLRVGTAERITERDIFAEDSEKEIADLIVKEICVQYGVDTPIALEEKGFFNVNEIFPNGNFYLDDKGITYVFNTYEIAAYAVGAIEVHLPYAKIKHLLL
ncbi:MAG: DUF3298 and DUF4163 domain-containing protein [Tannerellaceae bacterium]|jgi:hypothetical protein|nr:DUF3298 and DUF4163 domain-containing protein [Tannerellaceae bacterium]